MARVKTSPDEAHAIARAHAIDACDELAGRLGLIRVLMAHVGGSGDQPPTKAETEWSEAVISDMVDDCIAIVERVNKEEKSALSLEKREK